ncbi:hypothetical protein PHLGIDRAFT_107411 [Phlebiopsis gigantea 11061_1 CR5-6]|uniref:Uncharacterized protein n=1 Tax=Phlebiopsis gigantea (strain 11061_1 CR5-6) TaxID=745531 RepID=A0A0C3RWQ5_PHLG1|nr:hypothetical protein PHLGIDRAFT_107411 [Phlebiopsis gigantea 11061_1 CR5-6]
MTGTFRTRPPIRALLIDLSGTLHVGSSPTPGAVEALNRLRHVAPLDTDKPLPFKFCSNTSKEGRDQLKTRLRGMGFELKGDVGQGSGEKSQSREMWTSLGAVSALLKRRDLSRPYCLLEPSAREEILRDLPGPSHASKDEAEYDSVVIGLAPSLLSYANLNTAFRILLASPQPPLIATHRAKYIRVASDSQDASRAQDSASLSLGPGPFVAALEAATGVQAEAVGKPTRAFFETVISDFSFETLSDTFSEDARIAIVGDDVETDLGGGAVELGLWRVLVKTGKYRPGDETKPGITPPDEVFGNFKEFVDSLLGGDNL